MSTFTIELPPDVLPSEAQLYLSMKLFEVGKLSLGQAARAASYSKGAYVEVLGRHGVAVINYPPEDLDEELRL